MARQFIGPNGARFQWSEPLPGWIERKIESGEITEVTSENKKAAKSTRSKKAETPAADDSEE